jgi:hypothetical protein
MRELTERLASKELDLAVDGRKEERKTLISPCILHHFTHPEAAMGTEPACIRNLSTGGASLLVMRPMVRGEPVEVELEEAGARLFLAGLVAHCRRVEGGVHDVGVQFVTRSVAPIICGDAEAAIRGPGWVRKALGCKAP